MKAINPIIKKAVDAKLALEGIDWIILQTLTLDKANKTASATVLLEGETVPITVTAHYKIDGDTLTLLSLDTTRPWLTKAAALGLARHGGAFDLPGGMQGTMIKMML